MTICITLKRKEEKYCSGNIVVKNSQPGMITLFNIFTNEILEAKTSAIVSRTMFITENNNNDNLKKFDIVVFIDTISREKMKIFSIDKIHKDNTCDLICISSPNLINNSVALRLKNVKMNLLMHIEHTFLITHKLKYNNNAYSFQDYKFALINNIEKNIIIGTLEKGKKQSKNKKKSSDIISCCTINTNINKERFLLNRCFMYLNDPVILLKASSEHLNI